MSWPAIHPGEILADEVDETSLKAEELAQQLDVPARLSHANLPSLPTLSYVSADMSAQRRTFG
jgi:hypothetical protein